MRNGSFKTFTSRLLLAVAFCCGWLSLSARDFLVTGVVIDSLSREPIPYTAVFIPSTNEGKLTDDRGKFSIWKRSGADSIRFSVMGYSEKMLPLTLMAGSDLTVELVPTGVMLSEVVVKPKKEKYSKKNNPAVDFVNRIRDSKEKNDPRRHEFYSYGKYERLSMAINDFNPDGNYSWLGDKFKFMQEYVDTSAVSGKPILNFMVKEKVSDVNYSDHGERKKEVVRGLRQEGVDDISHNSDASRQVLEDVFREVDIYDNDVTLLQNRFVSPLAKIGPDFYKYYLTDTVELEGDSCVVLSFVPHTPETWGFIGKLYVPKGDSTMFVKRVEMFLPHTINVNFLDAFTLVQEFEKAPDGSRLKKSDDMIVEFSVLPGLPQLYARRNNAYSGFTFSAPSDQSIFSAVPSEIIDPEAYNREGTFWTEERMVPLEHGESNIDEMVARMRAVPLYYWTEKTLRLLVSGYVHTGDPSKFDYGPVNTSISYNTAEGVRLRTGGMTTAHLSKRWFARGYVAYGFRDHKWKYRGELEYSFRDKKYHSREFPVHSLRLTSLYDLDQLGQKYSATNQDNIFLSLKRMEDTRVTYKRATTLEYTLELLNNFSVVASVSFERQESTRWIPFIDGHGNSFNHYDETSFKLALRYAPGEKFVQGKTNRLPINLDAPVFELSHTYAPKGLFGSMFEINRTEFKFSKRFWFSAFGYLDAIAKAGHSWSPSPYMDLCLPDANLSYTIQQESYALMNPLEFINDSYASVNLTYWMNGLIFNRIPLVKKLKLREVVTFKCLWGDLSTRNNPNHNKNLFLFPTDVHTTMMSWSDPYMEISAGIDNIFRVLRIDSVWRLSYRHTPEAPDWGVRVGFHLAF